MKILIVDDSKINQMIAKDTLKKHDIESELFFADDGVEALEVIENESVDLVLLDIIMPNMTGIEVLKALEEKGTVEVEVIMLTSISDSETLLKCFEYGAVDYIKKPFDDIDFIARVRSALRNIRQKKTIKESAYELAEKNNQLHEANKSLKEAQFYLIQKEKLVAIGELAAGVAHEINNPLAFVMSNFTNIKSYSEDLIAFFNWLNENKATLMQASALSDYADTWEKYDLEFLLEDLPDVVDESHKGLERITKIVTGMRNFSRISEDDVHEYIDINDIIDEVLLVVNNQIKYVAVVEKNYTECPLVFCNKGEVEQVFVNLLVNAAQAIKELGLTEMGHIKIDTAFDDDHVMISICDDGGGMNENTLQKAFDPFFTTKPVGQGTGLGLSISHSIIVEKHQGRIDVKSEEGVGTCFNIYLPRNSSVV